MAHISTVVLFGLTIEREEREEGGYLYNITQVANALGFRASNAVRRFKVDQDYFMKAPAPHKARVSFWGTWDVLWQCLVGMKVFTKRSRQIYDDISRFVEENALLLEGRAPSVTAVDNSGMPPMGGREERLMSGMIERQLVEGFMETFNRAENLEKNGDLLGAIAHYDRCLAMQPCHAVSLNNRGHVLYRLVEFKRALMDYDRALAAEPMLSVARYNRGEVLYRLMRYPEAEKDLEEVLRQKPNFEEARRLLDVCRREHAEKKARSSATASCAEVDEEIAATVELDPSNDLCFADRIAHACLQQYYRLPNKGKPREREWGVLAGIVMMLPSLHDSSSLELSVVALATGTKCLSVDKMREEGDVVHDCHAEILVHRLLQHFLENEIMNATQSRVVKQVLDMSSVATGRFKLKDMVSFHLYISQAPCGDASIFPVREIAVTHDTVAGQKRKRSHTSLEDSYNASNPQDQPNPSQDSLLSVGPPLPKRSRQLSSSDLHSGAAMPPPPLNVTSATVAEANQLGVLPADLHRTGAKVVPTSPLQDPKEEGVQYHITGVLRTKPGQVENTLCLSCSDKIALWTVVGVQGALLSMLLVKPVYLSSVTVGSLFSEEALRRALITRVSSLCIDQRRSPGYEVSPPDIYHTQYQYSRSKEVLDLRVGDWVRLNPAGSAMVWNCADVHEVIVGNGKLQGVTKKTFSNPKLNSALCNRAKFSRFAHIVAGLAPFALPHLPQLQEGTTYSDVKLYAVEYINAKMQLFGQVPVFSHWIRSSQQWTRFTLDGSVVSLVAASSDHHELEKDSTQDRQAQDVMEMGSSGQLDLQDLPEFPGLSA